MNINTPAAATTDTFEKTEIPKREWLIELRKGKAASQEQVAIAVGVTRAAIAHYELGLRNPKMSTAKKLAAYLGCEWTRFF